MRFNEFDNDNSIEIIDLWTESISIKFEKIISDWNGIGENPLIKIIKENDRALFG